ncbi:MAG: hypothetical protein WCW87_03085 [Candidatus Paceibacterota bacterium]
MKKKKYVYFVAFQADSRFGNAYVTEDGRITTQEQIHQLGKRIADSFNLKKHDIVVILNFQLLRIENS